MCLNGHLDSICVLPLTKSANFDFSNEVFFNYYFMISLFHYFIILLFYEIMLFLI